MIRCSPASRLRLKRAVSSAVPTASATYRNSNVLALSETFVTVNSLLKSLVSTITGRICPLFPLRESSSTGSTNDPSELPWSLMTP